MEPVRVTIRNHDYVLKSDANEAEVLRIAEYVNEKLKAVEDLSEGLYERKLAILAALSIAGDYFDALKERDELRAKIRTQTETLIDHIDAVMDSSHGGGPHGIS